MKIGILTYWNSKDNYGQLLQCYAMQRFFQKLGHEAFLIKSDFSNAKVPKVTALKEKFLRILSNPLAFFIRQFKTKYTFLLSKEPYSIRHFDDFLNTVLSSTREVYTYEQLRCGEVYADAYVCGSDQIWSGLSPLFFLQFNNGDAKYLACAPSFGGVHIHWYEKKRVKQYLKRFCFLTAREQEGVEELHRLGFSQARLMPDPTLLLKVNEYQLLEKNNTAIIPKEKYLLLYLLGNPIGIEVSEIFAFAEHNGLQVVYVASQGRIDEYDKAKPTIGEWLSLINNAEYVITNSFHGTVFCLQYKKQFLVLPLIGECSRMNDRIYTLLNKYKLLSRLYSDNLMVVKNNIDWSSFDLLQTKEIVFFNKLINEILVG